jgi:hypothetical protein
MSYTDEQLAYIKYNKKNNCRLLACAGSGKTRCIIARITHLIESKKYDADAILMLTFSRFTRDSFVARIKAIGNTVISVNSISTIDKFAKNIIDENGTVDVSLLSFKLLEYLENTDEKTLKKHPIFSKIKIVFVDEAQDLNQIQYKIFCLMYEKMGVIINLVGDKSQSIYQFRGASEKFMMELDAVEFKLTTNFRSHPGIVSFSKHLRTYTDSDIICHKKDNGCKPIIMLYENEHILEEEIIDILTSATDNGIDLSEFAILCPVRGMLKAGGNSSGLCFASNILYKAKIPFKQFYEESKDEVSGDGVKFEPETNHVNVLSMIGSKGLEFNYVIIIGADMCLINKMHFDAEKHKNDQYLLYVACSRAIHNMYIFSKCQYRQHQFHFQLNPWFKNVPDENFILDKNYESSFFFPALKYRTTIDKDNRVGKLIDNLDCYGLNSVSNLLNFQNRQIKHKHKIFHNDYSTIEKPSSIFLSKYTESLFQTLYNIKMNRPHISFPEIEHIIEGDTIITGVSDEVISWYAKNKKHMTWSNFDALKNLDPLIKDAINHNFDRKKPFNSHIISVNNYYQSFILNQKIWIKNLYKKYLKCKNMAQIRDILFYLIVIKHSIETQHYFHIKSKGKKYKHILEDFKDMFDEIEGYVDEMDYNFIRSNEFIERWGVISRIDLMDDSNRLWHVKCTNEISLKHTILSIVSYLMYNVDIVDEDFTILNYEGTSKADQTDTNNSDKTINSIDVVINYINFIKGEEISYIYTLKSEDIKKLITILQNGIVDNHLIKDKDLETRIIVTQKS